MSSLPTRVLCGCEPLAQSQDKDAVDPRWAALKALSSENADSDAGNGAK